MGVDATGPVFNSIVAVEQYRGAEILAVMATAGLYGDRRGVGRYSPSTCNAGKAA